MARRSGERTTTTAIVPRRSGEPRSTDLAAQPMTSGSSKPGAARRLQGSASQVGGVGVPRVRSSPALTAEQAEAWIMYAAIGEVSQAVRARAALVSGCQFFVGLPPDRESVDGRPARDADGVALVDEGLLTAAEDFLLQIVDSAGSQRGLIKAQSENWDVAGVGYMVAWYERADGTATIEDDTTADHLRWEFVGPAAYRKDGDRQYLKLREGGSEALLPADAMAWRMWRRHPQYPDDSTSWVMACLPIERNLLAFQLAERSQALSAAVGKVHLVPADAAPRKPIEEGLEASTGAGPIIYDDEAIAANADGSGMEFVDPTPAVLMSGDEWAAHLDEMLSAVISEVLGDWQSGRAVQGGVLAIEGKFIEMFGKSIDIGRTIDSGLGELTDRALQRLKESADVAPEMLTGLGDTNRWNGAQIDDAEYRRYHRPHLWAMADDWTSALLWPHLTSLGYSLDAARQVRFLVSTVGVVADPDRREDAEKALKAGAINWPGYRELMKIPEDMAPTPEEQQAIKDFLSASKPAALGPGAGAPPAEVNPVNEAAGSIRLVAASGPGVPLERQLLAIELRTREALAAAGAVAFDQALNRSGAKLANLARKHKVDVPGSLAGYDVARHLGRARSRDLAALEFGAIDRARREEMFGRAVDGLRRHFEDIARQGFTSALEVLGITFPVGGGEGRSPHTGATFSRAELDAQIDAGWAVLDESLTGWADEVVFGDEPMEDDGPAPSVPVPVWRRAMAAVGGAAVLPGFGPIREAIGSMVFGRSMERLEPQPTGLVWVYGSPGLRGSVFPEHLALDGLAVTGEDDPQLTGAPWGSYWPGDHGGCQCEVIPTFGEVEA